jgi:hypothetical protein
MTRSAAGTNLNVKTTIRRRTCPERIRNIDLIVRRDKRRVRRPDATIQTDVTLIIAKTLETSLDLNLGRIKGRIKGLTLGTSFVKIVKKGTGLTGTEIGIAMSRLSPKGLLQDARVRRDIRIVGTRPVEAGAGCLIIETPS